jgi:hypothetical protein
VCVRACVRQARREVWCAGQGLRGLLESAPVALRACPAHARCVVNAAAATAGAHTPLPLADTRRRLPCGAQQPVAGARGGPSGRRCAGAQAAEDKGGRGAAAVRGGHARGARLWRRGGDTRSAASRSGVVRPGLCCAMQASRAVHTPDPRHPKIPPPWRGRAPSPPPPNTHTHTHTSPNQVALEARCDAVTLANLMPKHWADFIRNSPVEEVKPIGTTPLRI